MNALESLLHKKKKAILLAVALAAFALSYCYFAWAVWFDSESGSAEKAIVVLALGLVSLALLGMMLWKNQSFECTSPSFYWSFTAVFLALGLVYMGIFMPLKSPDEQSHYAAAYRYSDLMLGMGGMDSDSFPMRADDADMLDFWWIDHRDLTDDYGQMLSRFSLFAESDEIVDFQTDIYYQFDTSSRPIQLHLFPALGITLGRIIGLGAIPTFYLGRLFNLILLVVVAQLVLRITPVAKCAFAISFLLPITIHLAASYSYDVPIIAMSMLLGAICLKYIFSDQRIRKRDMALISVLIFLLAPGKGVYVAVAFLALLIPTRNFSSGKAGRLFKIWIVVAVLASLVVVAIPRFFSADAGVSVASFNSSGIPSSESYIPSFTLQMALDDPLRAVMMLIGSVLFRTDTYLQGFFGGFMSWGDDFPAPLIIPIAFAVIFAIALFKREDSCKGREVPLVARVACAALLLAAFLAISASMLIGYTASSELLIEGVQGRYFLPLIPLMVVLCLNVKGVDFSFESRFLITSAAYVNLLYCGMIVMQTMTEVIK